MRKYHDSKTESRIFVAVMLIILVLIMAVGVMDLCKPEEPKWRPSVICPMANANISCGAVVPSRQVG